MIDFNKGIKRTTILLSFLTLIMFGFGYALVPLYDVFCKITGLNGKTAKILAEEASLMKIDKTRLIRIQFDSNINGALGWQLKPNIKSLDVNPGKFYEAKYTVVNMLDEEITGQAIPSVSPQVASLYLKKADCFCFRQLKLRPREKKELLVRFEIDKDLPRDVNSLVLSYTFFKANKKVGKSEINLNDKEGKRYG